VAAAGGEQSEHAFVKARRKKRGSVPVSFKVSKDWNLGEASRRKGGCMHKTEEGAIITQGADQLRGKIGKGDPGQTTARKERPINNRLEGLDSGGINLVIPVQRIIGKKKLSVSK